MRFHQAFGFHISDIRAICSVNGNSSAAHRVTDYRIAGNGVTAFCKSDQEIAETFDYYTAGGMFPKDIFMRVVIVFARSYL